MGISHFEDQFVVFDSHCRNEQGFCCSEGASILVKKANVSEICDHIRSLLKSFTSDGTKQLNEQFELHGLVIRKIAMTSISRYKSNGIAVCTIPSDVFHDTTQKILLDNVSCSSNNFKPKSSNRFTLVDLPFVDISDSNILRKRKQNGKV